MAAASSSSPTASQRSQRAQIRHATFIDPQTATRSKRTFSLTSNDSDAPNYAYFDDPTAPPVPHYEAQTPPEPAWRSRGGTLLSRAGGNLAAFANFIRSDVGKGVFKCALAYLLASMCTFVPGLSAMFGRQDSKHLIATITVYFHPARSLGSMLDATILASVAFLYTAVVSIVSMSVSVLFTDVLNQVVLGHIIILVFFVGGGLGFIGWVKLKRGDALVNVACSLTSLSLITILTKEGSVQTGNLSFTKILYILEMIIAGAIATCLVSFLVFPVSGRRKLKENMTEVTDTLSDMLGLITRSFISGDEHELENQEFIKINNRYKKSSSTLAQNLKEAKYEHYLFGQEKSVLLEARILRCLSNIGQRIGGLRSAAAMQFVVVKQPTSFPNPQSQPQLWASWNSMAINGTPLSPGASSNGFQQLVQSPGGTSRNRSLPWRSPQQIFELFIDHLGPSMRALAYTMKEILDELPFNPDDNYAVANNPRFETSLNRALVLYKDARRAALKTVYDKKEFDRTRPMEVEADWEEAAACCGHFSSCLLDVAEQIKEFLKCLDDLQIELEEQPSGKTWHWMLFWKHYRDGYLRADLDVLQDFGAAHRDNFKVDGLQPHVVRTENYWEGSNKPWWEQKLFERLYSWLSVLRQDDNKFGIKVGFGAMLYALPAFIPATRTTYSHFRGEWGLLSYMLVCSMTIGASNTTGYQRLVGTCIGALLALAAWFVSNENVLVLALFGFCMAYWTAWIIVGRGKGPMGRFIMLTYNLSALYAYSLLVLDDPDDGDEEDSNRSPLIFTIALHRVIAVLTGCIWGMIITRAVWPISARRKLKDGLSLLWLRLGLIWKRDPLTVFTETQRNDADDHYMNLREAFELQRFLGKLQGLAESSKHEFELRRPFPHAAYDRILNSTTRVLEAFHTMNMVIQKDLSATSGELALLKATEAERAQLCSRISHQFGVLASSMKLEYSLATEALPNAERARDRLLAKIFAYRKEDSESDDEPHSKDEDYGLLYTYALVTGQLGTEIQAVVKEVEALFGIIDEESLQLQ